MADHKRQHYVPQFYLRGFSAGEGKTISLLVLDKSKIVPAADLKQQCYEDYFYGADLKLEKALSAHIESPASAIIDEILTTRKLPKEKTEAYLSLFAFVLFQHGRTVHAAEEVKDLTDAFGTAVIQETLVKIGKIQPDEVKNVKISLHKPVLMAVQMSAKMLPLILDLRLKLLINNTAEDFITSDNPVIMFNPYFKNSYPGSTTGWAVTGLQVFLPLSPRMAICLYDANIYKFGCRKKEQVNITSVTDVRWLNNAQLLSALECVYFADPSQGHLLQQMLLTLKGVRRSDKVGVRNIPQPDGAIIHTFKNDIEVPGRLDICKIITSKKSIDTFDREYSVRQPHLFQMHQRFWAEVRSKRYKPHEFTKYLDDLKADISKAGRKSENKM